MLRIEIEKGLWNNLPNLCLLERVEGMYEAVDYSTCMKAGELKDYLSICPSRDGHSDHMYSNLKTRLRETNSVASSGASFSGIVFIARNSVFLF